MLGVGADSCSLTFGPVEAVAVASQLRVALPPPLERRRRTPLSPVTAAARLRWRESTVLPLPLTPPLCPSVTSLALVRVAHLSYLGRG